MDQNFPKYQDHTRKKEGKFLKGSTLKGAHQLKNPAYEDNREGQQATFQYRGYGQVLSASKDLRTVPT
jgi:hypothetical protein